MFDFLVLGTLPWRVLSLFIVQMVILTAVVRGLIACAHRVGRHRWRVSTGFVVLSHGLALATFAAMSDFVEAGSSSLTFSATVLHSLAILWPLQVMLFAADLLVRKARTRQRVVS